MVIVDYNRNLYFVGQTAGSPAVNKLLGCKRKQEQLYLHGPKKLKLSESSDKDPNGVWVCTVFVIIIIAMSILTCQNFVVEGMSYEAQEVQVREEFSSQKL